MAAFAPMWTRFISGRGNFEPFMERYLDVWLHSYVLSSTLQRIRDADARIRSAGTSW
jgi:hypothetical protein